MVTPNGKDAGALFVTVIVPEQLSEVVGAPNTTPVAVHPELAVVLTFAGQVIVGGVLSVTVTV